MTVALLLPITRIGQGTAWSDAWNLIGWALAVALLVVFVMQQRRHPQAIVPMALFANRTVVACCALLFICFFNFIAMSVLVPLRLQLVAGFSAATGIDRLAQFPDLDAIRRSRLKKCTIFEMEDTPEIIAAQNEYKRLAALLWAGVEPCKAVPMKDREIFDFLGFE